MRIARLFVSYAYLIRVIKRLFQPIKCQRSTVEIN